MRALSHPGIRRAVAVFKRYSSPLLLTLTVIGLTWMLFGQRRAIMEFQWDISPLTLIAAVVLFAVPCWVQAISFHFILVQMTPGARMGSVVWVWMRSFLVRYAPSGLLAFALRVKERDRLRATTPQVLLASAYEQVIAVGAGAIVCVIAFLSTRSVPPVLAAVAATVMIGLLVALRPDWVGRWAGRALARFGVSLDDLVSRRWLIAATGVNMAAWLATGAASWLLIDALAAGSTPPMDALLGAVAFAWMIGVIVPILPGGIGIREAVLIGLLTAWYPVGVATALALGLRLVGTFGELLAIGSVEAIAQVVRRRGTTDGETPGKTAPPGI